MKAALKSAQGDLLDGLLEALSSMFSLPLAEA